VRLLFSSHLISGNDVAVLVVVAQHYIFRVRLRLVGAALSVLLRIACSFMLACYVYVRRGRVTIWWDFFGDLIIALFLIDIRRGSLIFTRILG
jgi:hypothetical protein